MDKGINLRKKIHNILYDIFKLGKRLDNSYEKYNLNQLSNRDIAFINNVCLNSMRYYFHTKNILNIYIKKKTKTHERILLISAITQIVFLDFKDYAVINCTVEISKKLKIFPGFINATLKKIAGDKLRLKNNKIEYNNLPKWFKEKTENLLSKDKEKFLNFFYHEPSLHIVFKEEKYINTFEEELYRTSTVSGFLKNKKNIKNIPSFKKGHWWVQDFSSSFPLINIDGKILKEPCIDLCSAPGGKSFQILARKKNIILNDKSKTRIKLIKSNLNRLNFKADVINFDIKNIEESGKYKFIILDAPCSAIGTIRKNPEIFFRETEPNFNDLIQLQKDMLDKAAKISEKNGLILYMVCSFLKIETVDQINDFLKRNENFSLYEFSLNEKNLYYKDLIKSNFMITLPNQINGYSIDGYFAAYLKRDK